MKRTVWIALLAVFAFGVILIARFPATWAAGFLPSGISCTQLGGTLWNGSCDGLVAHGATLGNAVWDLQPSALFGRKLAGHVELTRGSDFVRANVEAGAGGNVVARNLQAEIPLDRALLPLLPPNLSGRAHIQLANLRVENGIVTAVEGNIEAHDLADGQQRMPLGSYALRFPQAAGGGEPTGQLSSLRGPLDVDGTLKLTREPGFVLEGRVAAGPEASPQLVQQLGYLGTPDADGKRPFSLSGTF